MPLGVEAAPAGGEKESAFTWPDSYGTAERQHGAAAMGRFPFFDICSLASICFSFASNSFCTWCVLFCRCYFFFRMFISRPLFSLFSTKSSTFSSPYSPSPPRVTFIPFAFSSLVFLLFLLILIPLLHPALSLFHFFKFSFLISCSWLILLDFVSSSLLSLSPFATLNETLSARAAKALDVNPLRSLLQDHKPFHCVSGYFCVPRPKGSAPKVLTVRLPVFGSEEGPGGSCSGEGLKVNELQKEGGDAEAPAIEGAGRALGVVSGDAGESTGS